MAGIKEVAKQAGVSVATVSRVINGKEVVKADTAKRVYDAIEELNYRQNLFGKCLRKNRTNIIMVLLNSIANTFCASVIRSIDKAAQKKGYSLMICATEGDKKKEKRYVDFACNGLFDGIVILNSTLTKEDINRISLNIPTVQCNEVIEENTIPYVTIDNEKAAYDAVKRLIQNGKKKVAFFTVHNELTSTVDRKNGYIKALKENNIKYSDSLVLYGNYGYRNAVDSFNEFLDKGIEFDSLFAISDRMAAGAIETLIKRGYKVPTDIEVIGFDNTDISYTSNPKISTISQPHEKLGTQAFVLLDELIDGRKPENVVLKHQLLLRESTI